MLLPYFKNIFLHIICGHFSPQHSFLLCCQNRSTIFFFLFINQCSFQQIHQLVFVINFLAHDRGATTAENLRGTKVWVPTPGRQRPGWVLGAGGVASSRCEGIAPGKFLKTQMLNPAFWWLLAVKFLAFWKLRPRSWGPIHCWSPNLKVGDQSPPVPTVVVPMAHAVQPPSFHFSHAITPSITLSLFQSELICSTNPSYYRLLIAPHTDSVTVLKSNFSC